MTQTKTVKFRQDKGQDKARHHCLACLPLQGKGERDKEREDKGREGKGKEDIGNNQRTKTEDRRQEYVLQH